MKREFLQNLKAGDTPLPKEVIDAIMAENGKDIQKAKAQFEDYEDVKQQLSQLQQEKRDFEALQQQCTDWEEKYQASQKQMGQLQFEQVLQLAVRDAKGRNLKAISALLDLDALRESQDQQAAVRQALDDLKEENGYLFEMPTPPPYARGTGSQMRENDRSNVSLAGALREKFERK